MVPEMPSFALTLGGQQNRAPPSVPASSFPSLQLTDFHPIAFDSHFRSFLVGDKILVDWKTHALTFARV